MQVNGWTKAHIAVLDDPRLSWEAELVWIVALSYTRPDRPDCWPSLPELAKWTGLSEWEVRKAIEGLAYGELDRYERWKRAARRPETMTPVTSVTIYLSQPLQPEAYHIFGGRLMTSELLQRSGRWRLMLS
jgi:hypothetical protein